jgi:hypothetical protein
MEAWFELMTSYLIMLNYYLFHKLKLIKIDELIV